MAKQKSKDVSVENAVPTVDFDVAQAAAQLVKQEQATWTMATAFVTERIAFNMRNLIRQLRKNYWGIFDEPTDPLTGRKKIWSPLTESVAESVIKNFDVDTKDVNLRAKNLAAVPYAMLARQLVRNGLDEIGFGEKIDLSERQLAIDGTVVWKTTEEKGEPVVRQVELLNFYIDPVAESIQKTAAVIERAVLTKEEFDSMDGWLNKDKATASTNINPNNFMMKTFSSSAPSVEVFERWGLMPKSYLTGKASDANEWVEGHIVVSGTNGNWTTHLIEQNKKGRKPYEEMWYKRVAGRWYGRGVAEMLLMLQLYQNIIVNMRVNRNYVNQLGIFKIKKGSGITPQSVGRLASNGVVLVNSMDDVQQLVMQDIPVSSFNEEKDIENWARKVTSAFESVTGEPMPSTTSATATAIQSQSAKSQFVIIKEQIGMFLTRWCRDHFFPILAKNIKKGDLVRLSGNSDELRKLDEAVVNAMLAEQIDTASKNKQVVDQAQVDAAKKNALEKLHMFGADRYIELIQNPDFQEYDIEWQITNEEIDKGVLQQNLLATLKLAPQYADQVMAMLFDSMGLDFDTNKQTPVQPVSTGNAEIPTQNPMMAMQNANTINAPAV